MLKLPLELLVLINRYIFFLEIKYIGKNIKKYIYTSVSFFLFFPSGYFYSSTAPVYLLDNGRRAGKKRLKPQSFVFEAFTMALQFAAWRACVNSLGMGA
jgi:hypothetical protein